MIESAVDVAAGVLIRSDGNVLLAQRPERKVYAGFWEFPGGKVESGETARVALDRELDEELGIHVRQAYPWITQTFTYPHATVRIHFFRVTAWDSVPTAREHQAFEWQDPNHMTLAPMLPANTPILRALVLAHEYAISSAHIEGEAAFLKGLGERLANGLKLVELHERSLSRQALRSLGTRVLALCRAHRARLLVHADIQVAHEIGADGVHLDAAQLCAMDERPPFAWVSATCGNADQLAKAASLALDFVAVGPIRDLRDHRELSDLRDASNPREPRADDQPTDVAQRGADERALGWENFAALIRNYPIPVFARGGVTRADLEVAWNHGAHGVATSHRPI